MSERTYLMYDPSNEYWTDTTMPYGGLYFEDNVSETPTTTLNTWVKVVGTTIPTILTQFTSSGDNRLTYTGTTTKHFSITAVFSVLSANTNDRTAEFSIYKNGARLFPKVVVNANLTKPDSTALHTDVNLSTGDYIELWCRNTETTTPLIVVDYYMYATGG